MNPDTHSKNFNLNYTKTDMKVIDSGFPAHDTASAKTQNTLQISTFGSNQLLLNFGSIDNSTKSNPKHCCRDKPFTCKYDKCDKAYLKMLQLKAHHRVHTSW